MGLQISLGMDNEVPLSGTGRGRWSESERIAEGDIPRHGADDLCGVDQPRSRAYANWYLTADLGIEGGAVSEGEKFAQAPIGVCKSEEEIFGSASMG